MGKAFYDLTNEELCDLMCGKPEDEIYDNNLDDMIDPKDGGYHYGKDRQTEKKHR